MAEIQSEDLDDDMNELRRDAIRRAREMQARAQIPPSYGQQGPENPPPETGFPPPPEPVPPPAAANRSPASARQPSSAAQEGYSNQAAPAPQPSSGPAIGGALDFLLKDQEQTLILALLLILIEEKADSALIFAMMYLLL